MDLTAACGVLESKDESSERRLEALGALKGLVQLEELKSTAVGKLVGRLRKDPVVGEAAVALVKEWKLLAAQKPEEERPTRKRGRVDYTDAGQQERAEAAAESELPADIAAYRERLIKQKKEMCKDPPVMPPASVTVAPKRGAVMKRCEKTNVLRCPDFKEFTPNLSPAEIMQAGSFGGTYYRPIDSAVTGVKYGADQWKEFPAEWFKGVDIKNMVTSPTYDKKVNTYGVNSGGSLGMWESSGWISEIDPYGWFQWYCRFYLGRRSTDDARQVSRWGKGHGPKGRFRAQLLNKILAAQTTVDDVKISPVIRQTCQHWGYRPTQVDLEAQAKVKGLTAKKQKVAPKGKA